MSKTVNKLIGNVKRKYSHEDFNPFTAMEWIYENCLHTGTGHTVLIVGHTKRFVEDTIKAWQHVMVSKKLLGGIDALPTLVSNEFITHTGTRLRFEVYQDVAEHQMPFYEAAKTSSVVALFSKYNSPDLLNVIKETAVNSLVYDFSTNNLKKELTTEG